MVTRHHPVAVVVIIPHSEADDLVGKIAHDHVPLQEGRHERWVVLRCELLHRRSEKASEGLKRPQSPERGKCKQDREGQGAAASPRLDENVQQANARRCDAELPDAEQHPPDRGNAAVFGLNLDRAQAAAARRVRQGSYGFRWQRRLQVPVSAANQVDQLDDIHGDPSKHDSADELHHIGKAWQIHLAEGCGRVDRRKPQAGYHMLSSGAEGALEAEACL
mmetsp:Transcript_80219/g.223402  ORF Transcript_80219/g.223402 Transcript_80219/m.223402 type:complete len:220 (+) Transcript_80219:478-1137(+)